MTETYIPKDAVDRGRETDFWRDSMGAKEVQIKNYDSGNILKINEDGRADIVEHSHPDSTAIHLHVDNIAASVNYILIDLSNVGTENANYKHENTDYLHLEWLEVEVDGDNQADYQISFEFLENVDGTNGDRYIIKHFSGTKTAGRSIRTFENFSPGGWRCRKESIATHGITLNDANWSNTDTYGDTLDPAGSVNPGTGDLIVMITINAGTINLAVDIGYHSH